MVFFGGSPNNSTPMSDTWLIGAPSVTAVSPASGVPGGGTSVTVTGAGFSGVSGISFGSTTATQYLVNSTTSITVTSPAGALGIVDVVVTTGDGPSSTSPADKFAYEALPAVTAVNPVSSRMAGGGVVTITGTGFTNATTVMFGASLAANYTVVSSTQITTTAPAQAAGTVDVIVTTPVGTSAMTTADHFTYEAAPTVGAVSPVVGSTLGSTTVVITGTGYTGATVVDFGSGAGGFIRQLAHLDHRHLAGRGRGPRSDITVTTAVGTSATSPADQYTFVVPPTVTNVNPSSGPVAGQASVAITGTGFIVPGFGSGQRRRLRLGSRRPSPSTRPLRSPPPPRPAPPGRSTSPSPTWPAPAPPAPPTSSPTWPGPPSPPSPRRRAWPGAPSVTITGTGFTGPAAVNVRRRFGRRLTGPVVNWATSITATLPGRQRGRTGRRHRDHGRRHQRHQHR